MDGQKGPVKGKDSIWPSGAVRPVPEAEISAFDQKLRGVISAFKSHKAIVRMCRKTCLGEELRRGLGVSDKLVVSISIRDEVARCGELQKRRHTVFARDNGNRIENDGRATVDLVLGGTSLVTDGDTAYGGRDEFEGAFLPLHRSSSAARMLASAPSVTSTPSFRPLKVLGAFFRMLSASETGSRGGGLPRALPPSEAFSGRVLWRRSRLDPCRH